MSINKVSFGKIIDIKYSYRHDHSISAKFTQARFEEDRDKFSKIAKESEQPALALVVSDRAQRWHGHNDNFVEYNKTNRLITGEDVLNYTLLQKINPEYANIFANMNAQAIYYRA